MAYHNHPHHHRRCSCGSAAEEPSSKEAKQSSSVEAEFVPGMSGRMICRHVIGVPQWPIRNRKAKRSTRLTHSVPSSDLGERARPEVFGGRVWAQRAKGGDEMGEAKLAKLKVSQRYSRSSAAAGGLQLPLFGPTSCPSCACLGRVPLTRANI